MDLKEIAQMYLDGERIRQKALVNRDSYLRNEGNRKMAEAIREFQKTKQSQEILFAEVEKLDKEK